MQSFITLSRSIDTRYSVDGRVTRWCVGQCLERWYLGKRVVSSLVPSREQQRYDVFVFVFVVVAVVDVHNEAPANVTVVLSHRHADCQREYCRTVIGLFEETRADRRIGADLEGEKNII